ncbi:hypothetical protein NKG94_49615 [Micromonospora sp. M12]
MTIAHHTGGLPREPHFGLSTDETHPVTVDVTGISATLTTGELTARVALIDGWRVDFLHGDRLVTASTARSIGVVTDAEGRPHVHERLALGVGETVYGLGERFGPFVRTGRPSTSGTPTGHRQRAGVQERAVLSEQRRLRVFVDHPEHVSFEVGSEVVAQTQFSVEGQSLTYYVIDGPHPKDVLRRYTALTGRPARIPAWSYGLWLSTSFTTSYDERR